mgnify:CR=1 FL=1
MKTVVFHLQAKTCEKDISKLKEEILSYNIRIEEKELSEVKEEKDSILAITDQFSDVDYAKEHNIAVIFYETPGMKPPLDAVQTRPGGHAAWNAMQCRVLCGVIVYYVAL